MKTYGGNVSLEYLKILTNTSKNGTNAYYLLEAAKDLGFDVRAVKGNVEELKKENLPCIAHVIIDSKFKHFVVIHEIKNKTLIISDPDIGIEKMSFDDFNKITTNNYLLFAPNKKIPCIKQDKKFISQLVEEVLKYKKVIFTIFFFSFTYTLINIFTSYTFQFIIEDAIEVASKNNLYFISFFVIVFSLIKHVIDFLRTKLLYFINCKIDYVLMKESFSHIILLPYQYYKNKSTGDILSRMNDLSSIRDVLSSVFVSVFVDGILVLFVFIILFKINSYLTLISLFILIFYLLIIKLFSSQMQSNMMDTQKQVSNVNLNLVELIESSETVKNLNVENNVIHRFGDTYQSFLNTNLKFLNIYNFEKFLKDIVNSIGISLIIFVGASFVLKGSMSLSSLLTYNALIIYFLEPLKNIIDSEVNIKKAKVSIKRIIDLYNIEEETFKLDNKVTNKFVEGNIDIYNLSYSYNGRNKILNDININIKKGEKILLCGNSGSGKSTLVKILMKFYNVDNNYVRIDNKDINDYNLNDIRRNLCYVSQNEKLLTDTVYNNIVIDRDVDYDTFLKVCNIFGVEKIVNNNMCKYDMLLEENGFNISGGERQRIIMARALLKESSIYIFDESLSQLDINTEKEILEKLFIYLKGKTIIFITHRFNNNGMFDKCFKLEEGRIIENFN